MHKIMSPKKQCQRGLEEYITTQEQGDKQVYTGEKPAYLFMNNPIYRVGIEGDPAPNGLSSRLWSPWNRLNPTESPVHSLYPTIDTGSVFLSEKPMDMRWSSNRNNIPNVTATPQQVGEHNAEMEAYDQSIAEKLAIRDAKDRRNRLVPVYDLQGIANQRVPDGVHEYPYDAPYQNTFGPIIPSAPGMRSVEASPKMLGKRLSADVASVLSDDPRVPVLSPTQVMINSTTNDNIEHYTHVSGVGYGKYGYPQPSGYATVGTSLPPIGGYNVFPKHQVERFTTAIPERFTTTDKSEKTANRMWFTVIMAMLLVALAVLLYYLM